MAAAAWWAAFARARQHQAHSCSLKARAKARLTPQFQLYYVTPNTRHARPMNTISYAVLGFLTAGPRSGYDLKKLFAESDSLHWSGNNNQIYAALVELHREGLADRAIQQPEEGPAKKVYSITPAGEAALRE